MGLTTHVVHGARSERLMLLVHGYGADERDLAALVPHLDPSGRFLVVLPRGPYAAGPGYSWFHLEGPATVVAGTLRSSIDAVELVLDESERYGLPRESAVFGGFSQGGALALALAFGASGKPRPAGVLGMSGFLPPEELMTYDWSGPLPPVLLQHGTEDPLIGIDRARDSARALASHGVPVTWREYRMGHHATLDSVGDAAVWLDRVAAGERPSEPIDETAPPPADDGPVRTVTAATWDAEVMRSDKPVIVDFWAPWCQPCRQVAPIVEQIATMRPNYKVVKVNIDENPDLAQTYQVQSIPLVALFRNGRMERKSLGAKPRPQLEAELGMLVIP